MMQEMMIWFDICTVLYGIGRQRKHHIDGLARSFELV